MRIQSAVALLLALSGSALAPIALPTTLADRNVNMVAGTEWPGGDPFLQRQNEPSIAVSTRNPLHLLAGANDYRTVDIPGLENIKVIGDAWLGIFRSYDGGNTWTSTLLPGYPQDTSPEGMASPLKGYPAGADPVMRAGANGLFYLAGITLTRDANPLGAFFVARYLDHNDKESSHLVTEESHSIRYVDTKIIQKGTSGQFNDKPWMAVDIPRASSAPCTVDGQTIDGGNVYVAWTVLVGGDENIRSRLMTTRSTDCGETWQKPIYLSETHAISQGASIAIDPRNGNVYVVWRRIRNDKGETDALLFAKSTDFGTTFSKPQLIREITPYEQGTHELAFRTTMFPSMAVDGDGKIHIVWSERNADWRGRIALITSTDGATWSQPVFVANEGLGHQFMPTINFAHGKLTLAWYDQTEDHTRGVFTPIRSGDKHTGLYTELRQPMGHLALGSPVEVFRNFIIEYGETQPLLRRHTLDVYVAQADPSLMTTPVFTSRRASRYYFGSRPYPNPKTGKFEIEQMQYNAVNLPLFRQGTTPFIGDYIDIAAADTMSKESGTWQFKTEPSKTAIRHLVWTDNRDVRPPADGNWRNYTPVGSTGGTSVFDGTTQSPACAAGQTGMRNQNIYTTRVTDGLFAGSPGNTKPFFDELGDPLKRAFVVFVQNALEETKTYQLRLLYNDSLTIASFLQFAELPVLHVSVPPRSTIARSVFAVSALKYDTIHVNVEEVATDCVDPLLCEPLPDGLSTIVVLNPDIANPDIANPDIANPDIANPDIANAEVYNPDIANPDIANPDIANPDIANPDIANPDIANPDIANPDIANPDIANPDIANPDIANPDIANDSLTDGEVTDTTWEMTNEGNTTASYSVNLLLNGEVPEGFKLQLILHRIYTTPIAKGCSLELERHTVLAANINNPEFTAAGDLVASDVTDPSEKNATIYALPGETVRLTLRVLDPNKYDGVTFNAADNVVPVVVAHGVNTEDERAAIRTPSVALTITTFRVPDAIAGGEYSATLQAVGGSTPYTWSVLRGSLPSGITFDSMTGELSGTATLPGSHEFVAVVSDARGRSDEQLVRLDVVETVEIAEDAVSDASLNQPYSFTFTSTGGAAPFTWSIEGALPEGLTFSPDGVLSGTPLATGSFPLTVNVQDSTYPIPQGDAFGFTLQVRGEAIFLVTNTNDEGVGSLRQAILDANANRGFTDTIRFEIDAAAPYVITPATQLPGIDDPAVIDATPGGKCGSAPTVQIDGRSAGLAHGLIVNSSGTTIRGVSITGFASTQYAGIFFGGGSGTLVECSYVGLAPGGSIESNFDGVKIAGSFNNVIRGNVLSGNLRNGLLLAGPVSGTTGSVVQTLVEGNLIGVDPTGTLDRGNGANGVQIINSGGNTIGGTARNLISGNTGEGVRIDGLTATGNVVQGNFIGTTITGSAALPNSASGVYIRRAPGNSILGNLISGNTGFAGVAICGNAAGGCGGGDLGTQGNNASGNVVRGNRIGTDAAGTAALGNSGYGLSIDGSSGNLIGGTGEFDANVISGNGGPTGRPGVILFGSAPDGNVIRGNFIGTDSGGTLSLGNAGAGVLLQAGSNNIIGGTETGTARNVIAFNGAAGIALTSTAGSGNLLRFNQIDLNSGLGIDLGEPGVTSNDSGDGDAGPNGLQNFPVISSAQSGGGTTRVDGTLNSTPNTEFVIDLFHSPACNRSSFGEGRTWFGAVTQSTDESGNLSFSSTIGMTLSGGVVTATATSSAGNNTSEFSACAGVQ